MKPVELRLIAELMKNSRRSDRQLAKVIGVSQPTVSRLMTKLKKEGYIREFTMIPDFNKLGYEIMGITSIAVADNVEKEGFEKIRSRTAEVERGNPHSIDGRERYKP